MTGKDVVNLNAALQLADWNSVAHVGATMLRAQHVVLQNIPLATLQAKIKSFLLTGLDEAFPGYGGIPQKAYQNLQAFAKLPASAVPTELRAVWDTLQSA